MTDEEISCREQLSHLEEDVQSDCRSLEDSSNQLIEHEAKLISVRTRIEILKKNVQIDEDDFRSVEMYRANQVIVVGGSLAGRSAANQAVECRGKTVLLDKSSFCGGNSTKATSGINGAGTKTQKAKGSQTMPRFSQQTP